MILIAKYIYNVKLLLILKVTYINYKKYLKFFMKSIPTLIKKIHPNTIEKKY